MQSGPRVGLPQREGVLKGNGTRNMCVSRANETEGRRRTEGILDETFSSTAGGLLKPIHFFCGPAGYRRDSKKEFAKTFVREDLDCEVDANHYHLEKQSKNGPVIISFKCSIS